MPKFIKYFISVVVFAVGLSVGTYLGMEQKIVSKEDKKEEIVPVQDVVIRNVQGENEKVVEKDEIIETVVEETKLSPYAKMIIEKKFTKCGHSSVEVQNIPIELVNLTEADIIQKYPEWEIRSFKSDELSLFREIDANCNDHFVLKEKDGYIAIYTNVTEEIRNLKEITDIEVSSLPSGDIKSLEDGIYVYGQDALNHLIENFSS